MASSPAAGVQPVGGGLAGGARVEQGVGGTELAGGPAVEPVGAVPVVQRPDQPYRLLDGARLGLADAVRKGAFVASEGAERTQEAAAIVAVEPVMNARRCTSLSSRICLPEPGVYPEDPGDRVLVRGVRRRVCAARGGSAPDGLARAEAERGEVPAGEHVPEHPLVGVVGAADLPCLDPAHVPGVAAHVFADLAARPADRGGELGR